LYSDQQYSPQSQFTLFPPAIKHILIINVIFFIGAMTPGVDTLLSNLALYPLLSGMFMPFQLVTYMFLHANFGHIFFNLFALWMFGQAIEHTWGTRRFAIYYFATGIGAGILQLIVGLLGLSYAPVVGASGAVYGILLAFGMMYPNNYIMLLIPPIPIKAKYFVLIFGALELISGITNLNSGIAHFAHLGGMVFGYILIRFWGIRSYS
jgi:membrane associated rhomboid family serine protease